MSRSAVLPPDQLGQEWTQTSALEGLAALYERQTRRGAYSRFGKRCIDLLVALALLLGFLPLLVIAASVVVLTSGWPPFYMSTRIGKGGKPFRMWKLWSMCKDADKVLATWLESDPGFKRQFADRYKVQDDPRITPVGRFLMRSSIDELPQLLNVVRGEMSLVGPRPIIRDELEHYGPLAARLLSTRPGSTGLWQLKGRNTIQYPERVEVESESASSSSHMGDARLLLRTRAAPLQFNGS